MPCLGNFVTKKRTTDRIIKFRKKKKKKKKDNSTDESCFSWQTTETDRVHSPTGNRKLYPQHTRVYLWLTNTSYITCARCKKDVWRLSAWEKRLATGSLPLARASGRFSRDELTQLSQCLAKFRMSQSNLKNQQQQRCQDSEPGWAGGLLKLHSKQQIVVITRAEVSNISWHAFESRLLLLPSCSRFYVCAPLGLDIYRTLTYVKERDSKTDVAINAHDHFCSKFTQRIVLDKDGDVNNTRFRDGELRVRNVAVYCW